MLPFSFGLTVKHCEVSTHGPFQYTVTHIVSTQLRTGVKQIHRFRYIQAVGDDWVLSNLCQVC